MAPYALTPTVERGELPNGSWSTSFPTASRDGGSSTPPSLPHSFTNGHISYNTNDENGHPNFPTDTDHSGNGSANGATTPNSTNSSEDAFVHGYKQGYTSGFTKAHVELKHQPIAIVGMSCRLPGSVSTPDEFWELLARSRTGHSPIPATRFSANRFHHANPGKSGTTNAQGGNCTSTHNIFTRKNTIDL
jgi:hypothetical protein